ncbi:Transmembrane protein YfcA [hydrothermal vent metagenome]|uniref:Transmembrane protein YfcA n=1 Tax=hydrothermal vent metagenome TaxID=652676 RepID=A0A3B0UDS5_9ZZZZ
MLDPSLLAMLAGVGIVAGFVDAVAGGGGLIALPALIMAGLSPIAALATNKFQGVIGTGVAAFTFWRNGKVKLFLIVASVIATFCGAFLGALTVSSIERSQLATIVPFAMILIAIYFIFAPKLGDADRASKLDFVIFGPIFGFAIGFYDGFLGPGTGSFFTIGFVALFGMGVIKATAHTKILNFTSNIAALTLFIPAGDVVWQVALVMGVGQVFGGYLGAKIGIHFGARIIRPLVISVSIIMAIRLLLS